MVGGEFLCMGQRLSVPPTSMSGDVGLVEFAMIMAPTSVIMGFALSTVGFTCWNLAVPLFLNLFNFDIFDALLLTVLMDISGAVALVALYLRRDRVDVGFVTRFGPLCGITAYVSAKLGEQVLLDHQDVLRGTVGYIPFLFAVIFFTRAYRERQLPDDLEALAITSSASKGTLASPRSPVSPRVSGARCLAPHAPAPPDPVPPAAYQARDRGTGNGHGGEPREEASAWDAAQVSGVWVTEQVSPLRAWLAQASFALLRSPLIEATAEAVSPRALHCRLLACTVGIVACGIIGGILYFGGGVIFVSLILALFTTDDLPLATGTGCSIMACVCLGLLVTFPGRPEVFTEDMAKSAAIVIPCVVLGTSISSRLMLYLSKSSVLLVVATVALTMGILISFQHQIFGWAEGGSPGAEER